MSIQLKKEGVLAEVSSVSKEEMKLINSYTRRELKPDEVYVFSVVLCDNDIDRDNERFTVEALFELEKLFVGKTGIFDHNPTARNQTARIFSCSVEAVEGRKTALGDDYFRLKARAYIPVCESSRDIILSLDSGILKEVSVGCAVSEVVCSICGKSINECSHTKGESYGGKICCGELNKPYDAYEFSFVAVPAQKEAGVVKAYSDAFGKDVEKKTTMENILKKLFEDKEVTLCAEECRKLVAHIAELNKYAADGVLYRESLTTEVLRLSAIVQPDISRDTMARVAKEMTVSQLCEFKTAYEKKAKGVLPPAPMLFGREKKDNTANNGEFRI